MTNEELAKAFKPEFGNSNHINIVRLSQLASRKNELLTKTKANQVHIKKLMTEARDAEKRLYDALRYDYEKRLKINPKP